MRRKSFWAAVMVVPAAALFIFTFVIPLYTVISTSFLKTDFVTTTFVGLQNYLDVVQSRDFLLSLRTALAYALLVIPLSVGLSYVISLRLSRVRAPKSRTAFLTIYYLPTLCAGLIMAMVWRWVFDRTGLLAQLFGALGLAPIPWFSDGWSARVMISIAVAFSAIGGNCLFLLSGLLSISSEQIDQARADGANDSQISRYIIFPQMAGTLALLSMLQAIGTLQYWEIVYALTSGGPYKMTATTVYDIYTTAFTFGRHGLAAAKSVTLIVVGAILIGLYKLAERKK